MQNNNKIVLSFNLKRKIKEIQKHHFVQQSFLSFMMEYICSLKQLKNNIIFFYIFFSVYSAAKFFNEKK